MMQSLARYIALSCCALLISACNKENTNPPRTPPSIGVQTVSSVEHYESTTFPARISALREAQIRPQVDGIIKQRRFNAGDTVTADQPLYQLDDALYRAQQTRAQAAQQKAQATRDTQRKLWQRAKAVLGQQAISQQAGDEAEQAYLEAQAQLAQAEADVRLSALNLEYSQIKSPITGRVEISNVTEGALVSAKQAEPLTTVYQLDPIYVDITVSGAQLNAQREAWQQGQLQVHVRLENGERYPIAGELEFISASVSGTSAANLWRAKFANPELTLLPGMFVQAELTRSTAKQTPAVPQQALLRHPNGEAYVWVLEGEKLTARTIKVTAAINDQWLVAEGLQAGETIAVDGLQNARTNQPINPIQVESNK